MEHGAATKRRSVAVWTFFALTAMVLAILAVSAATSRVQAQSAAQGQYASAASDECSETQQVATFDGSQNTTTDPFRITSNRFRLAIQTTRTGADSEVTVHVLDENGQRTGQSITVTGEDDVRKIVPLGHGTFRLEIRAKNARYNIAVQECLADAQVVEKKEATNAEATNAEATNAEVTNAEANNAEANNAASGDGNVEAARVGDGDVDAAAELNCVEILDIFRASGASSAQYQYDDLKLERNREFDVFDDDRLQECLAREVIDRDAVKGAKLADTGGAPILPVAALLLAGVGIFVGRSVLFGGSSRDD